MDHIGILKSQLVDMTGGVSGGIVPLEDMLLFEKIKLKDPILYYVGKVEGKKIIILETKGEE